jgi:hypothetical protein
MPSKRDIARTFNWIRLPSRRRLSTNARNIVAVGVVFPGFPDAKMSKMQ